MKYHKSIITHFLIILFLTVVETVFFLPVLSNAQEPINGSGCFDCHSDQIKLSELTEDHITFLVPADFKEISSHRGIGCTGCHADPGGFPHPEAMGSIQCAECHSTEQSDYINSPHGTQPLGSLKLIPTCLDCHALHSIRSSSDPLSKIHRNNEWATCTECHQTNVAKNPDDKTRNDSESGYNNILFTRGIHSVKLSINENSNSLTCRDCHGFHSLSSELGGEWKNNFSTENKFCGECHATEFSAFNKSIHSTVSISSINGDVNLICSDCHIEHEFAEVIPSRIEESAALITDKCLECHLPVVITSQFALNARGYTEKIESIHGIKNLHGNLTFQNCSSCHGIHEISPFSGVSLELVSAQIAEKCGRCHPNASTDFATSLVHLSAAAEGEGDTNIFRIAMLILVYAAIGIFLITVFGDFYKKYLRKL